MNHHSVARRNAAATLFVSLSFGVSLIASDIAAAADEIVVTARKREESLQEVPISITAFNAQQLQDLGAANNEDVALLTVNFNTIRQVGRILDRPTIRGQVAPAVSGEPNASYFIDGVFVSGSISTVTLGPIERVEILRGPQSAQFGRATFAGAVNYVTRKPSDVLTGEVSTKVGSSQTRQASGWVSGPIIDDTLHFFASAGWDRYGGEWRNSLKADQAPSRGFEFTPQEGDSSRLGGTDTRDAVAKLVWSPNDTAELALKLGYTRSDDDHYVQLIHEAGENNCYLPTPENADEPWFATSGGAFCGTLDIDKVHYADNNPFNPNHPDFDAAGFFPNSSNLINNLPMNGGPRQSRINLPDFYRGVSLPDFSGPFGNDPEDWTATPEKPGTRRQQKRALIQYDQDVGGWTIGTRVALNNDAFQQAFDLDRTEQRYFGGTFTMYAETEIDDKSFEIRADSPADARLRGSIGLYAFNADRKLRQKQFTGQGFGRLSQPTIRKVENRALFGMLEYDFNDQWAISGEARVANDKKKILAPISCVDGKSELNLDGEQTRDESDANSFTPRITLTHQRTDETMLYALVAKGNKPAEFNDPFFRAATADACASNIAVAEGATGIKEEKAWTYETGAKTTWLDGRLLTNLAVFFIDWEDQAVFQTGEVNGNPVTLIANAGKSEIFGLEFESTFTFTDNLSGQFSYGLIDSKFVEYDDPFTAETTGVGLGPDGNVIVGSNNAKGNQLPSSPKHSFVTGLSYYRSLNSNLSGFARTTFSYEMRRFTAADNFIRVPTRKFWNGRVGVESANWTLTAYVNNILDERTPSSIFSFPYLQGIIWKNGVDDMGVADGSNGSFVGGRSAAVTPGRLSGLEFIYRFGG